MYLGSLFTLWPCKILPPYAHGHCSNVVVGAFITFRDKDNAGNLSHLERCRCTCSGWPSFRESLPLSKVSCSPQRSCQPLSCPKASWWPATRERKLGPGCGLVINVMAFYSDNESSNPAEVYYSFLLLSVLKTTTNRQASLPTNEVMGSNHLDLGILDIKLSS